MFRLRWQMDKILIEIISTYNIVFYALVSGVIFFVESESYTPVTFYGSDTHSFLTSYNEKTLYQQLHEPLYHYS